MIFFKVIFITTVFAFVFNYDIQAQHDSDSLNNILDVWHLDKGFIETDSEFNDSTLELFHISQNEEKNSILNSSLGNIGSAYISDDYFKRKDRFDQEFIFSDPYILYIKDSKNVSYFNTRKPYTSIMHSTSTKIKDIQTVDFIHTQNVTPYFNFGIDYDFITSKGYYEEGRQRTKLNSVGLTSNFKKNRYFAYFSYTYNKFINLNSGGYIDTAGAEIEIPTPRISQADITLLNQELSVTQKFKFGNYKNLSYKDTIIKVLEPKISISHNLSLLRKFRVYNDTESKTSSSYYENFLYQPNATTDSVGFRAIVNKIMINAEEIFENEKKIGFSFLYESKILEIFNFKRYFYLDNTNSFFENNIFAEFRYSGFKNMPVKITSDYRISGYRSGDFRFDFNIKRNFSEKYAQSFISLNTVFSIQNPDYFQTAFYSNHYFWENDFIQEKKYSASFQFEIPEKYFSLSANGSLIKDHIYLYSEDYNDIKAGQYNSGLIISSAEAEKTFYLKSITFKNKILWQHSSNDNILSLPELAIYHSTHFKLNLASSVVMYLGADIYYSTKYKKISFNPGIGQFYFENDSTALNGNYPEVSLFSDLKIKRNVMLYFRYSNLASFFENYKAHTTVNHYLIYGNRFTFGVRWVFKN